MVRQEEITLWENISEGLKLLALIIMGFGGYLVLAALGCGHSACHAPDTWEPIIQLFSS